LKRIVELLNEVKEENYNSTIEELEKSEKVCRIISDKYDKMCVEIRD